MITEKANESQQRALAELKNHTKGIVKSVFVTIYAFFTNDGYATVLDRRGVAISYAHPPLSELIAHPAEAAAFFGNLIRGPGAVIILGRLFWIVTTFLAVLGAFLYWRNNGLSPGFVFIFLLIGYFALTTSIIGPGVNGRFRVPVQPFIFIFSMYAAGHMLRRPVAGGLFHA